MRFGILGPFEVADDDGRGVALGGHRQRALLAILLLHAGEVVSSDRLIEELWGGRPPATAVKTVQVYVSKLRKALGDRVLVTRSGGYMLDIKPVDVDVGRFQALVGEAHGALQRRDPRGAAESLRAGLALWRGRRFRISRMSRSRRARSRDWMRRVWSRSRIGLMPSSSWGNTPR